MFPAGENKIEDEEELENSNVIKMRRKIMPFLESVEEARQRVLESSSNDMGSILDPEGEQDNADSEHIGLEEHPDYGILNPDGVIGSESTTVNKAYRQIIQENLDKLI